MKPADPILDELHSIRDAIAAACDNDIRKIAEAARAREKDGDVEVEGWLAVGARPGVAMRIHNPIVEELHAIRERLAEASDNDLAKIVEAARARQQTSGHAIVELPPKRVDQAPKAP